MTEGFDNQRIADGTEETSGGSTRPTAGAPEGASPASPAEGGAPTAEAPEGASPSSPGPEGGSPTAEAPEGPTTVLYVEDNPSNLALVERILVRRGGTELVAVKQGRLAFDAARRHRPSLILLDRNLPDMPGEEILEQLQSDPETSIIPVVMVTGDVSDDVTQRFMSAGARDYLTKPIDVPHFIDVVDGALSHG